MSVFIDASAMVAIISNEAESRSLAAMLNDDLVRLTSGLAQWEAARALGKRASSDIAASFDEVRRYCDALNIEVVAITEQETAIAVLAQHRYGKGTGHPAKLNMGDCFAYACARTNDAKLLYNGDDFIHTDAA